MQLINVIKSSGVSQTDCLKTIFKLRTYAIN
ncbi:hypothetical protein TRB37_187 [Escherichia phage vB_Eco_TB37]